MKIKLYANQLEWINIKDTSGAINGRRTHGEK